MSAEEFFATVAEPANLAQVKRDLAAFVTRWATQRVALVTSGGTMVPLERNMVRFIDNFSHGSRGAASAERLLAGGYAVVFLHRSGSMQPFARRLPELLHTRFLDASVLLRMRAGAGAAGIELDAGSAETAARCVEAAEALRRVQAAGTLLSVEFETLQDYLHYLRACVCALAPLRRRALLYSAAAVSDFFSAPSRQAVHKIQSGDGPLELVLEQTPKLLASIRAGWAPEACVVSFKLETDPSILFDKAAAALARYGVDAVVANELQSRARRVWLVERSGARREIATAPDGTELEAELVAACADLHTRHINAAAK